MKNKFDVVVGDIVFIDGTSGFCDPYYTKVTDIITKYDEDTGIPYEVICCENDKYHGNTGIVWNGKGSAAYFLAEKSTIVDVENWYRGWGYVGSELNEKMKEFNEK